jgi:hypothetical protein
MSKLSDKIEQKIYNVENISVEDIMKLIIELKILEKESGMCGNNNKLTNTELLRKAKEDAKKIRQSNS